MTVNITRNIAKLKEELALLPGGGEVCIVAATKTRDRLQIQEAVAAGIRVMGENRPQELHEKFTENAYKGAELHFFGHLQTNKVKLVVGNAALIHSIDSERLLYAVNNRALELGIIQDVLVEVNIAKDLAKHGFMPEMLTEVLDSAGIYTNIRIRGLMTVAPKCEDSDMERQIFAKMYKLFIDNKEQKRDNVKMVYLSMGMSGDYRSAILEGSNMIRIGTGIFGPRD